jgi:hypothetical protein
VAPRGILRKVLGVERLEDLERILGQLKAAAKILLSKRDLVLSPFLGGEGLLQLPAHGGEGLLLLPAHGGEDVVLVLGVRVWHRVVLCRGKEYYVWEVGQKKEQK